MPLTATQEGEAPGSRAPALRRGRSSSAAAMPTTTARSMALVRTRRQPSGSGSGQEPSARSKRRKRNRRAALNPRSNKRKKREEREEEEVSSAGSSPLRVPHIRDEMYLLEDLELEAAIMKAQDEYSAKLARQALLPTLHLHMCRPPTCMVKDPNLLRNRESKTTIVLSAAPSVVGLSSSIGGHLLTRCSGFWVVDWDGEKKLGTFLTTTHLIRTKSPSLDAWLGKDEYDCDAEVLVHLLGDTTEKKGHHARLLYYQKHYNIALFEVKLEQSVQVLHLNGNVECAEEVFELGRDESSFLTISHGMVQYRNSKLSERYHYLYVHGTSENLKYDNGGPVINSDGKVVGMVSKSTRGSFVPSSILLKCLDLFKEFGRIPRPQLGLKFSAIKFLDPPLIEQISCKCNIADGLIIEEVSGGSPAEKLGFRLGDVIECVNGEHISTTVELENMLLSKCKDGISGPNSKVDLEIGIFHVRRKLWRSKKLSLEVSEDPEVIVRGGYWPFEDWTSSALVEQVSP